MENQAITVSKSYAFCRKLTKHHSSFYLGILFNDRGRRNALFAIYAWMRYADDIADNEHISPQDRYQNLVDFSRKTALALAGEQPKIDQDKDFFWPAFMHTVNEYQLPGDFFWQMIECQQQDLTQHTYQTLEDLKQYCRLAASSVGQVFIRICGYNDKKAVDLADKCGIAFQLTNIIRDINEDLEMGRVYLPCELLGVNNITPESFCHIPKDNIINAKETLIEIADELYQESFKLGDTLESGKLSFLIMINYYYRILKKMSMNKKSHLIENHTKLTKIEKISVLLTAMKYFFFENRAATVPSRDR